MDIFISTPVNCPPLLDVKEEEDDTELGTARQASDPETVGGETTTAEALPAADHLGAAPPASASESASSDVVMEPEQEGDGGATDKDNVAMEPSPPRRKAFSA